jgi:hypothetical protein
MKSRPKQTGSQAADQGDVSHEAWRSPALRDPNDKIKCGRTRPQPAEMNKAAPVIAAKAKPDLQGNEDAGVGQAEIRLPRLQQSTVRMELRRAKYKNLDKDGKAEHDVDQQGIIHVFFLNDKNQVRGLSFQSRTKKGDLSRRSKVTT